MNISVLNLLRKHATKTLTVFIFFLGIFAFQLNAFATGLMQPVNSSLQTLTIQEHHVSVVIEDGYAITSIEQRFFNPNQQDLEAIYSFPVPNKAAVGEFTYWIDGKPITGEVVEKQQARQIYQQEKQAGRESALTEKNDFIDFKTHVYPVRAQQSVRIKLVYIQPTHIDMSIGRYVYPLEDGGTDTQANAFWTSNDEVTDIFSFKLVFRSSYPVEQFRLPKHPNAKISKISDQQWSVEFTNDQHSISENESTHNPQPSVVKNLNEDIVVYWRHQANLPGRVELVTYKEEAKDRGTFMMTLTPGDDLAPITQGRDWVFILDYSGSMSGKYSSMVEGVNKGLEKLNPEDRFRIIIFNDAAHDMTQGFIPADSSNVQYWSQQLLNEQPSGSTNLYDGIERGIKSLDSDRSSALILVTDGVSNVGVTEKQSFLKLLESNDVRLFTFVMGNSADRPLLESMTNISNGFAISVSNSDDIVGQLMQATSKLTHEAMHDINIKISGIKTSDITPEKINSLYRGQQLIIMGHYFGDGQAKVELTGKISGQKKTYSSEFAFPDNQTRNPEIERLWAFNKIEDLENKMAYFGKDADSEQAITDLAIDYGLVTNYTSLIVLREEQFLQYNIDRDNQARVENEHNAQTNRQTAPVQNNRVDTQQPMYQLPTPSHRSGGSGGSAGSLSLWLLLMLIPFMLIRKLKAQR